MGGRCLLLVKPGPQRGGASLRRAKGGGGGKDARRPPSLESDVRRWGDASVSGAALAPLMPTLCSLLSTYLLTRPPLFTQPGIRNQPTHDHKRSGWQVRAGRAGEGAATGEGAPACRRRGDGHHPFFSCVRVSVCARVRRSGRRGKSGLCLANARCCLDERVTDGHYKSPPPLFFSQPLEQSANKRARQHQNTISLPHTKSRTHTHTRTITRAHTHKHAHPPFSLSLSL